MYFQMIVNILRRCHTQRWRRKCFFSMENGEKSTNTSAEPRGREKKLSNALSMESFLCRRTRQSKNEIHTDKNETFSVAFCSSDYNFQPLSVVAVYLFSRLWLWFDFFHPTLCFAVLQKGVEGAEPGDGGILFQGDEHKQKRRDF